jgi:predicted O-methyltransferase YrrM
LNFNPCTLTETHQLDDELLAYAVSHSTEEEAVLAALRRKTWQTVLTPQMLSDPIQGKFLQNWSRMVRPKRVLELGTYTGYSTICLATGLQRNGRIDTIEPNEELNAIQDEFWKKAGIEGHVHRHNSEASNVLPSLAGPYDVVWIDADKPRTGTYMEQCLPLVRPGGWMLVDNVLWWGKVLPSRTDKDGTSQHLESICTEWAKRHDVRTTLLPIRDGILIVEKIGN